MDQFYEICLWAKLTEWILSLMESKLFSHSREDLCKLKASEHVGLPKGTSVVYKRSYELASAVTAVYIGETGCAVTRSGTHDSQAGKDSGTRHYSHLKPGQQASVHILAFIPEAGIKAAFQSMTRPGKGQDRLMTFSPGQLAMVARQIIETVCIHYFAAAGMPPRFVALLNKFGVQAPSLYGLNVVSGLALSGKTHEGKGMKPLPTTTEGLEMGCPVLLRKFFDGRGAFSLNLASNYSPVLYLQRTQIASLQESAKDALVKVSTQGGDTDAEWATPAVVSLVATSPERRHSLTNIPSKYKDLLETSCFTIRVQKETQLLQLPDKRGIARYLELFDRVLLDRSSSTPVASSSTSEASSPTLSASSRTLSASPTTLSASSSRPAASSSRPVASSDMSPRSTALQKLPQRKQAELECLFEGSYTVKFFNQPTTVTDPYLVVYVRGVGKSHKLVIGPKMTSRWARAIDKPSVVNVKVDFLRRRTLLKFEDAHEWEDAELTGQADDLVVLVADFKNVDLPAPSKKIRRRPDPRTKKQVY